jgi:signal transduction histidine kinase
MGLGLGAVEQLIDADPDAAKTMLAKVQDNSARALIELRDLVRGIHPPVLAERGLGDAVRALALDTPLPVRVHVDLPYRLEPPVESAAYFAISKALGAAQRATEATIDIQLQHDTLQLTVSHDGHVTEGLHGIERRLGAFDGTLTAHSPKGGPTTLRMTIQVSAG